MSRNRLKMTKWTKLLSGFALLNSTQVLYKHYRVYFRLYPITYSGTFFDRVRRIVIFEFVFGKANRLWISSLRNANYLDWISIYSFQPSTYICTVTRVELQIGIMAEYNIESKTCGSLLFTWNRDFIKKKTRKNDLK